MPLTTAQILENLVAFDTTSRNANLDLIAYAMALLEHNGATCRLTYDDTKSKANLLATFGDVSVPGIVLSGHTDVVPVDGQDWTTEPFFLTERDGKYYGRGTCDMKGFIASVLAQAPNMQRYAEKRPVHIALSYDEEVGCIGVQRLLADLTEQLPVLPAACIVGEPTGMKPMAGHKGIMDVCCHVHGKAAHSSMTHVGVSAIENAAKLIAFLHQMAERMATEGPFDHNYDPPYTTMHAGMIQGGTAPNIIAQSCKFMFEFRPVAAVDPRALLEEIKAYAEAELAPKMRQRGVEAPFSFDVECEVPGMDTPTDSEIVRVVCQLTGANGVAHASFATEGGRFQKVGIPTVICGPGHIEQAHKPDEFVSKAQLVACDDFLKRLLTM
ncbi:MAG: acetylornithine deacetylase [Proteobacteria bacterium]|nr:acetylornithine deacetylase [Pseudomonadota bacterium]